MDILIKKTMENAKIPTRGSKFAAGYDLYSAETKTVLNGETVMFHSGIAMGIPNGYFGAIFARSGLSSKHGIRPATCVSVIDSDYTGEIGIPLHNDSDESFFIREGDRIAQMIVLPCQELRFVECKELPETERGSSGYGSTGVK